MKVKFSQTKILVSWSVPLSHLIIIKVLLKAFTAWQNINMVKRLEKSFTESKSSVVKIYYKSLPA